MPKIDRFALAALMMVALLLLLAAMVPMQNGPTSPPDIAPLAAKDDFDYEVFRDGEVVHARNRASGTVVFSSSDDGQVIQWTLNALPEGGLVLVREGEYRLAREVDVPSDVHLAGEGPATVFWGEGLFSFIVVERTNVTLSGFTLRGSGPLLVAGYDRPASNILVQDVVATLDSSHEGAFYTLAINTVVSNVSYVRCAALDCGTSGFINNGNYKNGWIEDISFIECRAVGCGVESRYNDWVVGFDLAERVNVRNMLVLNCEASDNWQSGFHFEPPAIVENAELRDCVAIDNGRAEGSPGGEGYGWGYLLYDRDWHDIRLINCHAEGNWRGDTDLGPLTSELIV